MSSTAARGCIKLPGSRTYIYIYIYILSSVSVPEKGITNTFTILAFVPLEVTQSLRGSTTRSIMKQKPQLTAADYLTLLYALVRGGKSTPLPLKVLNHHPPVSFTLSNNHIYLSSTAIGREVIKYIQVH